MPRLKSLFLASLLPPNLPLPSLLNPQNVILGGEAPVYSRCCKG